MSQLGPTEPPIDDAVRCKKIVAGIIRGEFVTSKDRLFRLRMFHQYPVWYSKIEQEINNEQQNQASTT